MRERGRHLENGIKGWSDEAESQRERKGRFDGRIMDFSEGLADRGRRTRVY